MRILGDTETKTCYINVTLSTGIRENIQKDDIKIYPNPSEGKYSLVIDDEISDDLNIAVFDVLGEKVAAKAIKRLTEDKIMIDLSNLPDGVYFIQGFTTNRAAYTKKVVLLDIIQNKGLLR